MEATELKELSRDELIDKILQLEKEKDELNQQISYYENGGARLYYALQKKMTEMARVFNSQDLTGMDFGSKSDATFDRVFKLLEKCETISKSAEALGAIAGITGDEEKDTKAKPKRPLTAETISQAMGIAGSAKKEIDNVQED